MELQYETVIGKIPADWKTVSLKEIHYGKNRLINPQSFPTETFELYSIPAYYETREPELKNGKFIQSTKFLTEKNTILFGKINPRNPKVWKIDFKSAYRKIASTEFIPIMPNKDTSIDFIYQILASDSFIEKSKTLISGTTPSRARIDPSRFYNLIIPYPSLKEQQKISSILSKVDELIQKTDQIIEQNQRLKKGLMQRLLTKGIGHTKFESISWNYGKKIEIPKEWNILFLDEVAKRGTGHTPDAEKPEYYNGGIKWVSLADSKRLDNIYISETTKEISNLGIENSSAVVHPAGTVILSRDAGIGKSAILKIEMAVSQHFIAWRCGENLNNHFLYYMLQYWKPLFESIAIGTTIKTIGLPFFKKLRIPLPSINEQQKIASILSNVDELDKNNK